MPFFFEAAILSRMRSPVTSRSNWAKDKSTLSVRRPIELVVLNCCVTETNDTTLGVEEFDQAGKIDERAGQPVDLVDDHDVDPAGSDIGDQMLQSGSLQIATGEPAIVIAGSEQYPALVALAADEGLAGFALRRERVEFLLQPFLGGFAGVDRATLAAGVTPRHCCSPSGRQLDPALARTGGWRVGSASSRRRAALTTPCR